MATQRKARAAARRPARPASAGRTLRDRRLRVEQLEARRLLAVVTVDTDQDAVDFNDGRTSLREAIFATNLVSGPDEIRFRLGHDGPATIVLRQGELKITDSLTITGPGADLLTIDASGNDPTPDQDNGDGSRILHIADGVQQSTHTIVVSGLTLTGGDPLGENSVGGAILNLENLTMLESVITGNHAGNGGGVYSKAGNLSLVDSCIVENSAAHHGGGIYGFSGTMTAERSVISSNSSMELGGGLLSRFESLSLAGVAVTNNRGSGLGGGIHSISRTTIVDSTISGNVVEVTGGGGGIFHRGDKSPGNLAILRSTISNNFGAGGGAGIRSIYSGLSITDSFILANQEGGGVRITGSAVIAGTTISHNVARGSGGGVRTNEPLTITDSIITGNSAGRSGGGIFVRGDLTLTSTTVSGNISGISGDEGDGGGGGIFIAGGGRSLITASTISDNSTPFNGGGIVANTTLDLVSSTVSGNTAGRGGGIDGLRVNAHHSTIVSNKANSEPRGAGIFMFNVETPANSALFHSIVAMNEGPGGLHSDVVGVVQIRNSILGSNLQTQFAEAPIGVADANGNLIGGPLFGPIDPMLAPLADNGGPTLTHALFPGSPAFNAGDPEFQPGGDGAPQFDQRGEPFRRVAVLRIDIGAFEAQFPPGAPDADFNRDGRTDGADFLAWQRGFGTSAGAPRSHGDANTDGDVDASDLTVWSRQFAEPIGLPAPTAGARLGLALSAPGGEKLQLQAATVETTSTYTAKWAQLARDAILRDRGLAVQQTTYFKQVRTDLSPSRSTATDAASSGAEANRRLPSASHWDELDEALSEW